MRVNREAVLRSLSVVAPGISTTGIVEQSNCFIFRNGKVQTYNEEIYCEIDSPLDDVEGAVQASSLLDILNKLPDEELDVSQSESELLIKAKRRRAAIRCEQQILVPDDLIEVPEKWKKLGDDFSEALNAVKDCAANDGDKFYITCIHITPEFVEACDNYQMARFKTKVPIKHKTLVREASITPMISLGVVKIGETKTWLHFKNEVGLVYSVRRHLEDYLELTPYFECSGDLVTFPTGLDEAVARAEVFTAKNDTNYVLVKLSPDKLHIEGSGVSGWYKEIKRSVYSGPAISFMIQPKIFGQLGSRSKSFHVADGRLVVESGNLSYATRIGVV